MEGGEIHVKRMMVKWREGGGWKRRMERAEVRWLRYSMGGSLLFSSLIYFRFCLRVRAFIYECKRLLSRSV